MADQVHLCHEAKVGEARAIHRPAGGEGMLPAWAPATAPKLTPMSRRAARRPT